MSHKRNTKGGEPCNVEKSVSSTGIFSFILPELKFPPGLEQRYNTFPFSGPHIMKVTVLGLLL